MTDPYRPVPPTFPRVRLLRAGLDEDAVGRVESEYEALGYQQRRAFDRYVTARSDEALREQFAEGVTGDLAPAGPPVPEEFLTAEQLGEETVDELEERIRKWNARRDDDAHLTLSGRKAELIGRLLDAYEAERNRPEQPPAVSEPVAAAIAGPARPAAETTAADQLVPTAPTATTPEGAPEASSAASAAPAGGTGQAGTPAGPQAPTQPADAAGAGIAPSTTTED